jgi:ankyrin repeat protein
MQRRQFLSLLGAAGLLPGLGQSANELFGNAAPIAETVLPTITDSELCRPHDDLLNQKEVEAFFEYIKEKSLNPKTFSCAEADKLLEQIRFVEPIWKAAVNGEWDTVKQYLEQEPELMNVTGDTYTGYTMWYDLTLSQLAAGWCSDVEVLQILVSLGADVKAECTHGETPLRMAAKHNFSVDVLKYLVSQYADVNAEVDTLLYTAAFKNSRDVLEYLVSLGADVKAKTKDDWTPLHRAAKVNSVDVLEYFVSLGADVNAMTTDGTTPLSEAVRLRNDKAVKYLISQGADVNAGDQRGMTMLHKLFWGFVLCSDRTEEMRYLISLGADTHAKDNEGKTALDYAYTEEDKQILREWMDKKT